MSKLAPYSKALWAAIAGFVAPAAALVIANGGDMSGRDWLVAVATCVVASAAVYAAPKNAAPARRRNQAGHARPALLLMLALILATAGTIIALASPASATTYGWSGQRCDREVGYAAKVCVNIHTVPFGSNARVDQVQLCNYKVPEMYDNGFQGTAGNSITFETQNGTYIGIRDLNNPGGASTGGVCSLTNMAETMGNGACFDAGGTMHLSAHPDRNWRVQGRILGGAC